MKILFVNLPYRSHLIPTVSLMKKTVRAPGNSGAVAITEGLFSAAADQNVS